MSRLTVRRVESRRDMERFIRVPWRLYAEDAQWVPPLLAELRTRLRRGRNPYFEHAKAVFFLAERGDQTVGRISAQVCELAEKFHGRGMGHFGFFECEDSQATTDGLFHAAEDWLKQKEATHLRGPFSLSFNDEIGVLIEGFHRPPAILMGHHPPYYESLIHGAGLRKEMDMYAYYMDLTRPYTERIQRVLHRVSGDKSLQLRPLGRNNFRRTLDRMLEVFNEAWADNWGHIPVTQAEVSHMANTMRPLIGSDSVLFTEVDGEVAGFMVVLPNLNELIRDLDGKLFPTNWLRILWRLRFARFNSARVPLMGIRRKYQRTRIGAAIAFLMIDRCRQTWLSKGVTHCEMSWILEDNKPMRGMLEALGASRDKTYRIYSKSL